MPTSLASLVAVCLSLGMQLWMIHSSGRYTPFFFYLFIYFFDGWEVHLIISQKVALYFMFNAMTMIIIMISSIRCCIHDGISVSTNCPC